MINTFLVDVEFHLPAPGWQVERVRCPIFLPPMMTQRQILRAMDVLWYSRFVRHRSLVWCNDMLLYHDQNSRYELHSGDYVRIALPPPLTPMRHISTRCIARLLQMWVSEENPEVFYWVSDFDSDLDPMPTQSSSVTADDLESDSSSSLSASLLIQTQMLRTRRLLKELTALPWLHAQCTELIRIMSICSPKNHHLTRSSHQGTWGFMNREGMHSEWKENSCICMVHHMKMVYL